MLLVRRTQAGWRDRIRNVDSAAVAAPAESTLCSNPVGQRLCPANRNTDHRTHRLSFDSALASTQNPLSIPLIASTQGPLSIPFAPQAPHPGSNPLTSQAIVVLSNPLASKAIGPLSIPSASGCGHATGLLAMTAVGARGLSSA